MQARVRAAVGEQPKDERIVTTFVHGGLSGTEVSPRLGDDGRSGVTVSHHTATGMAEGTAWRQNFNGRRTSSKKRSRGGGCAVGAMLLRLFDVYLDHPHGKIHLVPTSAT